MIVTHFQMKIKCFSCQTQVFIFEQDYTLSSSSFKLFLLFWSQKGHGECSISRCLHCSALYYLKVYNLSFDYIVLYFKCPHVVIKSIIISQKCIHIKINV